MAASRGRHFVRRSCLIDASWLVMRVTIFIEFRTQVRFVRAGSRVRKRLIPTDEPTRRNLTSRLALGIRMRTLCRYALGAEHRGASSTGNYFALLVQRDWYEMRGNPLRLG